MPFETTSVEPALPSTVITPDDWTSFAPPSTRNTPPPSTLDSPIVFCAAPCISSLEPLTVILPTVSTAPLMHMNEFSYTDSLGVRKTVIGPKNAQVAFFTSRLNTDTAIPSGAKS